jgi:hypothetical protein
MSTKKVSFIFTLALLLVMGFLAVTPTVAALALARVSGPSATSGRAAGAIVNAALLDGVDVGMYSTPTFTDIDADGNLDLFIGAADGTIYYYKNTGTPASPHFIKQTGPDNPLASVDVGQESAPSFIDIDADGDVDAFIGELNGYINYYQNTGNATSPLFVERTGPDNPLDGFMGTFWTAPSFVDIDQDGDFDFFLGSGCYPIKFYRNIGSAATPIFQKEWPDFESWGVFTRSKLSFADYDNDGDVDLFAGEVAGVIHYFENMTAEDGRLVFVESGRRNGPACGEGDVADANPLSCVDVGVQSAPALVDIDADGDLDTFIGAEDGTIYEYMDSSPCLYIYMPCVLK